MGPTWTKLVEYGVEHYPGATHGINNHRIHPAKPSQLPRTPSPFVNGQHHTYGISSGIIADADFRPMQDHLDKMQLDTRCSKHMFTIWTHDHQSERKMDWIYRNIPGAKVNGFITAFAIAIANVASCKQVERRAHQTLTVPKLPNQEVFQTLIDLHVDEQPGGYQDRTGKKNEK